MNNHHKHTHGSNIFSPDSSVKIEEYAKRAVELGDKILSSVEHGYQGNYFETYTLAKKYNLKFIYGTEAYWVKDRFEADRTNNHMCLFAKTNEGRKAINLALSEANVTGYYYKPRLDFDLIFKLPPNDVFITTACLAFWHYEDTDEIIIRMHNYFGENFMLEIQYHDTDIQKEINKRVLKLHEEQGINIIVGQDSHYIYETQHQEREEVLLSKGVKYDDEGGWYMDYPTNEQIVERLKTQGILNDFEIELSMNNTKIFETFDDFDNIDIFSKRIKLPTLYPELSQEERDNKLKKLINQKWNKYKKKIPLNKRYEYIEEIRKEVQIVVDVGMSDYLLYDYEVVKRAVEKGGMITPSGRGSCVSFFINTLLGLSKVDRISAPVKMFPERFMSTSRVGSLMDIDLNSGNPEVFAEAQREISGEHNSYPMIAYGTFKKKSAWKMYSKAQNLDFDLANNISSQIGKYEDELKHTDEDDKDTVDIYDFIDKEYHQMYEESVIYQGIISDKKPHPCAWLIYDFDIREEIGLIKVKSEGSKKETIVCLMDGKSAETFNFMKNDLLKVDVVKFLYEIQNKTNFPIPTQSEIIELCNGDKKVWGIYSSGCTLGVNQYEKEATSKKSMRYCPTDIAESTAFVASIRPAFKSIYGAFERREDFNYDIKSLDKVIRDCGVDASFVLYQEILMAVLAFAGFPVSETYDIIKAISKKRTDKVLEHKAFFFEHFKEKIIQEDGIDSDLALEATEKVWTIISDASAYSFNASHSFCMAYDSLLCAYYKAHYPLEFYETLMQEYTQKGNKDKVALLKKEMTKFFGIEVEPFRFRQNNKDFIANKDKNTMQQSLSSIKSFGDRVGDYLYLIHDKEYKDFIELLVDLNVSPVDKSQLDILIKLDYFSEFGKSKYLSKIVEMYNKFYNSVVITKKSLHPKVEEIVARYSRATPSQYRDIDKDGLLKELLSIIPDTDFSITEKVLFQYEWLGYCDIKLDVPEGYAMVVDIDRKYKNPVITMYRLKTGETVKMKCKLPAFEKNEFSKWDIINTVNVKEEGRWKITESGWTQDWDNKEEILKEWRIVV